MKLVVDASVLVAALYDGTYVALAERLDAPLATLDQRLAGAPGTRSRFMTPR